MCQERLRECDLVLEDALRQYENILHREPDQEVLEQDHRALTRKPKGNEPHFNVEEYLRRICGVDLLAVGGIGAVNALTIISEHGADVSAWTCYKKYTSWLGLCCGSNVSGKKSKSGKTRAVKSRVANAYRMAASTVRNSRCPLGKFYRRMKAKFRQKPSRLRLTRSPESYIRC